MTSGLFIRTKELNLPGWYIAVAKNIPFEYHNPLGEAGVIAFDFGQTKEEAERRLSDTLKHLNEQNNVQ